MSTEGSQSRSVVSDDGVSEPLVAADSARGRWIAGKWNPLGDFSGVKVDAVQQSVSDFALSPRMQYAIFAGLFIVALVMRLIKLGDQAVHHDESIHGYYGWRISVGGDYIHSPLTHGMFLFEIIAATFILFGDSDFTLRLSMAIFGSGLVLVPLLLRKYLGVSGTILASTMLAFSPALFYFSRFARNDIFMAVFALLLVVAMFRYIDERKPRWLYIGVAIMALAMSTKETAYILLAIFGLYLLYRSREDVVDVVLGYRSFRDIGASGEFLVMLGAISLPFAAPLVSIFQGFIGLTLAAEDGTPGIATGAPDDGIALVIAVVVTLVFMAVGIAVGYVTLGKRFWLLMLIFWSIYALVMTNFGSNFSGVVTGVWQSMGYWIAQQDVRRGDQPWYYYIIMVSVYEFLPFFFSLGISIYYAIRSGLRSISLVLVGVLALAIATTVFYTTYYGVASSDIPSPFFLIPLLAVGFGSLLWMPFTLKESRFTQFLIFWSISNFLLYSWAGEKMPWLVVNVTLPFVILAAQGLGRLLVYIDWLVVWRHRGWLVFPMVPLFIVALWRLAMFDFGSDFSFTDTWGLTRFLELWGLIAFLGLLLLSLYRYGRQHGFLHGLGLVATGLAVLMLIFTFRASVVAAYVHGDVAKEMLVYTQTSPDLHATVQEIENARQLVWDKSFDNIRDIKEGASFPRGGTSEGAKGLSVAIDTQDGFAWPWTWYLRSYEGAEVGYILLASEGSTVSESRTVLVVNDKNVANVSDSLPEHFGDARYMIHRWWFPEVYKGMTPSKFFYGLTNREEWPKTVNFWLYRELSTPLGYQGSYVYFSDYLPDAPLR